MSKIYDAQDRITSLLGADPYFSDVPVLSQRKGELANELVSTLMNVGIGVFVMLPVIEFDGEAHRIMLKLNFIVFVSENPTVNATGKPAEDVMEKIFTLLHWQPNSATDRSSSRPSKFHINKSAAELVEPTKSMPALLNYILHIVTWISLP